MNELNLAVVGEAEFDQLEKALKHYKLAPKKVLTPFQSNLEKYSTGFCKEKGITYEVCKPEWKNLDVKGAEVVDGAYGKYNKLAGRVCNQRMIENSDKLLVFSVEKHVSFLIKEADYQGKEVIYWPPQAEIPSDEDVPF